MSFEVLKHKRFLTATIVAVASGASAICLIVGCILLASKIGKTEFQPLLILPSFAFGVAVSGVVFAVLRPNDMRLAKQLDKKYNLGERLQTMVEFSGGAGFMFELQRKDAAEALSSAIEARPESRAIWWAITVPLVSVSLFLTSVCLPKTVAQGGGTQSGAWDGTQGSTADFEYTVSMQADIADLLNNVRGSALIEVDKILIVRVIEALDAELKEVKSKSVMQDKVIGVVNTVKAIANAKSFRRLSAEIKDVDASVSLAYRRGATIYCGYKNTIDFKSYENVRSLGRTLDEAIEDAVEELLSESYGKLGTVKIEDGFYAKLSVYYEAMSAATSASAVPERDALRTAQREFCIMLSDLAGKKGLNDAAIWNALATEYKNFQNAVVIALDEQCFMGIMNYHIGLNLGDIFDVSVGDMLLLSDEEIWENKGGEQGGTHPGGSSGGGYGEGLDLYGSDDVIFDPTKNAYVKYGDVLQEYTNAAYNGVILSDGVPEEIKEKLIEYFTALSNAMKDKQQQNGDD